MHSENYFERHSQGFQVLAELAQHYPVSLHGVGMSLGSADPLDPHHLQQLSTLAAAIKGGTALRTSQLGQHWRARYFNDLLPVPYTRASLRNMSDKILQVQQTLGCRMLIENPSSYLQLPGR